MTFDLANLPRVHYVIAERVVYVCVCVCRGGGWERVRARCPHMGLYLSMYTCEREDGDGLSE